MASDSSRSARSARRDALRNSQKQKKVIKGRVAKSPRKSTTKSTHTLADLANKSKTDKVKSPKKARKGAEKQEKQVVVEQPKEEIKKVNEGENEETKEESKDEAEVKPEEIPVEQLKSEDTTFVEKSQPQAEVPEALPSLQTPADSPRADFELASFATPSYEPLTPSSPIESDQELLDQAMMNEDELQTYLREFEAVSSGADITDTEVSDMSVASSPVIEPSQPPRLPSLGLNLDMQLIDDMGSMGGKDTKGEDLKMEEYLNYVNDEPETVSVADQGCAKRRAPFCVYNNRSDLQLVSSSFNPNKRTLIAAWQTMAPDVQHQSREAYFHSVLLAAASLNQRSLLSGRARETMAPAVGTY